MFVIFVMVRKNVHLIVLIQLLSETLTSLFPSLFLSLSPRHRKLPHKNLLDIHTFNF